MYFTHFSSLPYTTTFFAQFPILLSGPILLSRVTHELDFASLVVLGDLDFALVF